MTQPVPITGYEGRYEIHPDGRVWSNYGKGRFLTPFSNAHGYAMVRLCNNCVTGQVRVHRLLATTYIPNPDNKPCVDHIDRNPSNNALDNLRWVTHAENQQNRTLEKRSKTGVQGVGYRTGAAHHRSPWHANITLNGKQKSKSFATKEEAVACRKAWELDHYIQAPAI
tara:strand:- start:39 stop:542 length:504 start_codon:yes stop_codon:yes gene_type:complete